MEMLANFVQVATAVRESGGTLSFEWPRYCYGWAQPQVLQFILDFDLEEAIFDGCDFGMMHDGESVLKPWRIVTDHHVLANNLSEHRCKHPKGFKHKIIEGSFTPKSALYHSLPTRYVRVHHPFDIPRFN